MADGVPMEYHAGIEQAENRKQQPVAENRAPFDWARDIIENRRAILYPDAQGLRQIFESE